MLSNRQAKTIVRIALREHAQEAATRACREVCSSCPDYKCLAGSYCGIYQLFMDTFLLATVEEASIWN